MTNLLNLALPIINNIIDATTGIFQVRSCDGETINDIGVPVPSYGEWLGCNGTVQPVKRDRYEALGLDWSKNYINIWGSVIMHTIGDKKQPDQVKWRDRIWNVITINEWNPHNGWVNATAVEDTREREDVEDEDEDED